MNNRMEYHIDLLKDDGATICGSTALVASNNVEAIEKAKHWAASLTRIAEDAWLQINLNGSVFKLFVPANSESFTHGKVDRRSTCGRAAESLAEGNVERRVIPRLFERI